MTKLTYAVEFFNAMRSGLLGPVLTTEEVLGCNEILKACGEANWPIADTAYALATAYHETAGTMLPIKEIGSANYFFRQYDIKGNRPHVAKQFGNLRTDDGVKYAGRGYVQLTGAANYAKADAKLGLKGALILNPDLAMRPNIAAPIMVRGMAEGWFTGKKNRSYLPSVSRANRTEFTNARRIINSLDRAEDIADYALKFQSALSTGGWA